MKIAGKTDKGRKRRNNEDSFLVDSDLGFMIVADGMANVAFDTQRKTAIHRQRMKFLSNAAQNDIRVF